MAFGWVSHSTISLFSFPAVFETVKLRQPPLPLLDLSLHCLAFSVFCRPLTFLGLCSLPLSSKPTNPSLSYTAISLVLPLLPPPFTLSGFLWYIGPVRITQDNVSISRSVDQQPWLPFPRWGLGCRYLGVSLFCLPWRCHCFSLVLCNRFLNLIHFYSFNYSLLEKDPQILSVGLTSLVSLLHLQLITLWWKIKDLITATQSLRISSFF